MVARGLRSEVERLTPRSARGAAGRSVLGPPPAVGPAARASVLFRWGADLFVRSRWGAHLVVRFRWGAFGGLLIFATGIGAISTTGKGRNESTHLTDEAVELEILEAMAQSFSINLP